MYFDDWAVDDTDETVHALLDLAEQWARLIGQKDRMSLQYCVGGIGGLPEGWYTFLGGSMTCGSFMLIGTNADMASAYILEMMSRIRGLGRPDFDVDDYLRRLGH